MTDFPNNLRSDPANANRGTVRGLGMVERSLQQYGAGRSILASKDGIILAGNKTYDRAVELGIPVKEIESDGKTLFVIKRTDLAYDDPRAKELAIADNRSSETGLEWDADVLAALADDGVDLSQFWFEDELADLLAADEITEGLTDPDDVPDVPDEPITKPGDLWLLGRHRLLCGDSTNVTDVDRLMDGKRADLAFTSPPYNIAHGFSPTNRPGDYLSNATPYENYDDALSDEDYRQFLSDALTNTLMVSDDSCFNVGITRGSTVGLFRFIAEHAESLTTVIYWVKSSAMPMAFESQRGAVNNKAEPIFCFSHKSGRCFMHPQFEPGEVFNVFESGGASGNKFSEIHGATFPMELPLHFVENFSRRGAVVLDVFGGSGTTLIACEQAARAGYLMELDPKYCDVIVRRYEQFTGETATRAEYAHAAD